MQRIRIFFFLLLLTACIQTSHSSGQSIQRWVGRDAKTLVQQWGQPTQMIKLREGHTYYIYFKTAPQFPTPSAPPVAVSVSRSGRAIIIPTQPTVTKLPPPIQCRILFELNTKNIIVNAQSDGSMCE